MASSKLGIIVWKVFEALTSFTELQFQNFPEKKGLAIEPLLVPKCSALYSARGQHGEP